MKSANFLAKIRISSAGKVSGNVYDLDTGEEYLLLRVESNTGSFSAVVKAECRTFCRILPVNASSKTRQTGLRMKLRPATVAVPLGKLTGDEKDQQEAAVLNLKLAEEKLPALLKKADFFPAYHMNKQNWLSVLLNNDLPDEEVLAMLDESRAFTERKK